MQHCEDDVLALVALGEQPPAADAAHLAGCATCRAEVESFGRVVTAGRGDRSAAAVVEPPTHVWDGIAAATGVTVRPRSVASAPAAPPARPGAGAPPAAPASPAAPLAPVVPLVPRSRGRFRGLHLVAAAAAALVVGAAGGVAGTNLLGEDAAPAPTVVVARAVLDPLPADPAARGKAVVVEDQGGAGRVLQVDVSSLGATDGFFEVWLIDASVKKMVPIGILSGATGRFTIPAELDLSQYPVVDISAEPLDGNPTHSGKSLLRGVIPG